MYLDVPVAGGSLRVAQWGSGPNVVLAAHGITANSMSWRPVARRLDDEWTLLAPDLRGRGHSADVTGPSGAAAHAQDLISITDHLGLDRVVLSGESMGAYVVVVAAAMRPDLVERLVLVDGGLPIPLVVEPGDADAVLEAMLGPALARLRMTFPSVDSYLEFWREHPAVGGTWNSDVEAYLAYDLLGDPPQLHPSAREEAVRADGRDLLVNTGAIEDALRSLACPVIHLRAERGLTDAPPGLQPAELVDAWSGEVADCTGELVDDTTHYSIAFGDRGAAAISRAIRGVGRDAAVPR